MSAANSPRGRSPTSSWRSRVASTPLLPSADCWRGCSGGDSLRAVRCGPPRRCSLPGTWGGRTGSFSPTPCGACSPPGWRDGSPDLSPDEKEMKIRAWVFISDEGGGLHQDYARWLEEIAPHEPVSRYLHNRTGEDNGDAHLKRQVMGREVVVAVTGGKLDFGPWERIFYGEFDGRRKKRVLVKIIGE